MSGKSGQQGRGAWRCHLSSLLALLVVVLVFPAVQAMGLELPQTLIEQGAAPVFLSGQPVQVQAMVTDPAGVLAVRCYFRYGQEGDFVFVAMEPQASGLYQAVLPAPDASVQAIDYGYLAVNARRQVVRTPLSTLSAQGGGLLSVPGEGMQGNPVHTDLASPPDPDSLKFANGQIAVTTVDAAERYGLVAGLYNNRARKMAGRVTLGNFGGFELQPDGKYVPLEGSIDLWETTGTGLVPSTAADETDKEEPPPPEIIGPDISGDTWEGICYYGWGESFGTGTLIVSNPTPVTAVVTHEGNLVTITLSDECVITFPDNITVENVGQYFQGSIDWAGNMLLLDQRDPVQTWSTHWGPATESDILIGDYVTPFDPETNPYPDYYVIELTREWPPPPPPPEPDPILFLPAVYKLLLH